MLHCSSAQHFGEPNICDDGRGGAHCILHWLTQADFVKPRLGITFILSRKYVNPFMTRKFIAVRSLKKFDRVNICEPVGLPTKHASTLVNQISLHEVHKSTRRTTHRNPSCHCLKGTLFALILTFSHFISHINAPARDMKRTEHHINWRNPAGGAPAGLAL